MIASAPVLSRALFFVLAVLATIFSAAPGCSSSRGSGLLKRTLVIGGHEVVVEVAATDSERQRGLMFRESLGEDEGMIFLFPIEETRSFWMKSCKIDLSIAYLDGNGTIVSILEMKKPEPGMPETLLPGYPSGRPAQFAIEMRANWFSDHGVQPGIRVEIPSDLRELTRP